MLNSIWMAILKVTEWNTLLTWWWYWLGVWTVVMAACAIYCLRFHRRFHTAGNDYAAGIIERDEALSRGRVAAAQFLERQRPFRFGLAAKFAGSMKPIWVGNLGHFAKFMALLPIGISMYQAAPRLMLDGLKVMGVLLVIMLVLIGISLIHERTSARNNKS